MGKEQVIKKLEWQLNNLPNFINKDQILGIFEFTPLKKDFSNPNEFQFLIVVVPTFEQLVLQGPNISLQQKVIKIQDDTIIIENLYNIYYAWLNQKIDYLNILYTKNYFFPNKDIESIFKRFFIKNKEAITHYDKQRVFYNIAQEIKTLIQREDNQNNGVLYNINKLYTFLYNYVNEKEFSKCFIQKEDDSVFIKYCTAIRSTAKKSKKEYIDEVILSLRKLHVRFENVQSPRAEEAKKVLNSGVVEIMKIFYKDEIKNETPPIKDGLTIEETFLENLTVIETKAYNALLSEINGEGIIAISNLIKKYSISRPVFSKVLDKLQKNHLAEIENKGRTGTYIKLLIPELRQKSMTYFS